MNPPVYYTRLLSVCKSRFSKESAQKQTADVTGTKAAPISRFRAALVSGGVALLLTGSLFRTQAQTLPCNYRALTTANFSVSIVAARSTAAILGTVTNTGNVIDTDLTNFGSITSTGIGGGGSISAQVTSMTMPAGSTAGYSVQNTALTGTALLNSLTIRTYLNGTQQDVSTAAATPLVERTDLAASGQRAVGIVTTKPYNEIQITFAGPLLASSTLKVYVPFVLYPTLSSTATTTDASNPAVSDGVLSASVTGGRAPYLYTYTGPNTSVATSSSTLTGRAPGSYTVTVSDANGCTDTDVVTVGFPPQFTCTPNIAYLTSSNLTAPVSTTAQRVNLVTGATTTIKSGILASPATNSYSTVNGLGFNPKDNYLYGAVDFTSAATGNPAFGSGTIARFDANFDYKLYSVTNVVANTSSADIDLNGIYYLYNGITVLSTGSTTIQRIDLTTGVPTALTNLTLSPATALPITDFAFSPVDSKLYTLSTPPNGSLPSLYRIAVPPTTSSATSATVTNLGSVSGVGNATSTTRYFGAAYFDGDGNFYTLDNTSGTTYRIAAVHTFTGSATRTATFLSTTGKTVSSNDGARCPTAQVASEAAFAFNCGTATVAGSFTANGTSGQAGTVTIPLTGTVSGGASAGIASFTVLSAGFAANPALYTTTLTAGQTSVSIPILYNGTGAPGTRTLVVDSEQATNAACSTTLTITGQPDLTTSLGQPPTAPLANQANSLPVTINNIGNVPTSGVVSSTITLPANVTAPAAFTTNGFSCSTAGSRVVCTSAATLANGASTTLAIPFTPGVAAIGTLLSFTNTVATSREVNTANNTATITVSPAVAGQPDLITAISQPVPNLVVGQTSSLPISVSNIGTAATTDDITQTLTIPATVTAPATFTSNGFACSTTLTTVSCVSSAILANGSSTTFAVPITPTAAAVGVSPVFSTTVATDDESNTTNNTASLTVTTAIAGQPDLTISLAQPTPVLVAGRTSTLPVTINNIGSAATSGVVTTTLTIPSAVTAPAAFTSNGFSCTTATTRVSCTNSAVIAVSSSTTFAVPITPLAAAIGTNVFTATVLTGNESTTANNTATLSTTVSASVTAAPDAGTVSAGTGGTAVASVVTNDVVNGAPAVLGTGGNATVASVGTYPAGITLNTAIGSISVAQGTTPGSYTVLYQLCDLLASPTCATTTVTVTVLPSINPTPDSGTVCAGLAINNVTANDLVNGQAATLGVNATVTAVGTYPAGITLNPATGSVSVTAGVAAAGSYTLVYQLCSTLGTPACATTTATITVNPSVTATLSSATICNGTSTTLTATGGANYLFSTGLTNTTGLLPISQTTNGSNPYSVTVTSAQGCTAVASGTVTVNPSVTATLSSATICNGTSATLMATGGSSYRFSEGTTNTTGVLLVSPTTNGSNPYSVTVTSAQGCTAIASGTVTVNAAVTATLSSATICNGTSTTLTATGGSIYRFSTGLSNTTGLLPVSPTTNGSNPYSVTVTSVQGCSAVASGTVTVNPSVTATLSSATICNGTSTTLTATGGASYLFSEGTTTTTGLLPVSPTTNGSNPYSVTVTSAQGCTAVASGTVTVNPSVTATLSSATICNGTSATLTATGGTSYRFSEGTVNATGLLPVSPTTNGSNLYSVTVTSGQGCTAIASGTVTVNPSVTATLSSATICNGTSATLTATGGTSYRFSTGLTNATGLLPVSPTTNGANPYSVTVTSAQGCSAIAGSTVTVNPSVTATLSSATICSGANATLTATGGINYRFSEGTTNTTGILVVAPTTNGSNPYSVTVTSAQGCGAVASGNVTVNPSVAATLTSATICNGTSTTLTATGGTSYRFSEGTTNTTGLLPVSPTTNGSNPYSVTVTSAQGCSAIASGTVTVNPSVTATLSSATICNGTSATLTATGGSSYRFSEGTTNNTGLLPVSPTTNGSNPYSVTVTSAQGCSAVASGTVTVNPSVIATLTSTTICNGLSSTLTAGGAGVGGSYVLNPGNLTSATGVFVVSPTTNGVNTYSVTATSQFGCVGVATGTVTINPSVTATLTNATICNGTSATLTATGGSSYRFSEGTTNTTGILVVVPTTNGANPYSVTVTSTLSCSAVASGTVTVNAAVTATLSSATICNGTSATLTATGGTNYRFSEGTTNTTGLLPVSPTTNGSNPYSVTVTSAQGCTAIASGTVTVNPSVTATLSSATVCNGTSATLTATGGTNYRFSEGTTNTTGILVVAPTTNGSNPYSVTVTSAQGCTAIASGTVTVNPSVTATLSSATICNGTSATLTATGGSIYRFSTGLSNTTGLLPVSPTTNGSNPYSVTVTSAQGCSAIASGTVAVNPSVTATLSSATICNGTSATLTATGGGNYRFSEGTTNTTGLLVVSPATNGVNPYSVTVTSGQGCTAVTSGIVTVNPSVTATLSSASICNGSSTTLTATGGTNYLFSTGLSNTTGLLPVSPTTNGSNPYSVTVTSAQGCTAVASGTITVNPSVTATLSVATICNGTSTTLTATGGSSYRFSEGTTNTTGILVVAPNANGNNPYSVTVTSAQGCTAVATGNVTVNPSVTATLSSATICNGTSATLTATGGVSYRFGPGNTNSTGLLTVAPTVVGANPYSVTVTSAQGCSAVAFGSVTVNALPQPTISGSMSVCAGQPISLTASPTTGLTYAWRGPTGNLGSSNPLTIASSTSANSGTYQVTVTDVNGCTAVASQNVTVKPVPQAQIVNTSIVCSNNSPAVAIATQVTGGTPPVSYAWYRSGAAGVISTAPNPTFSIADTYSLIVTDASGCMSNTATVNVMTPNPLAVNVQTSNARCYNGQGSITVTTNGGTAPYTVSYYNTSGLMSTTTTSGMSTLPTMAGSYTIVVMDANGCSLTQTAALTQPPLLVASLTGSGPVCAGQNTGSISTSVTGGTAPYSYSWSNGATTPNLTGLSGGSYSVVITDANGCVTSGTATLPTNPLPGAPTVSVTQPTCVTLTGTIQVLTPTSGVQYSFDNGISYQVSPTRAGLQPDVYQLRAKDNTTGCVSLPTSVTINPVPNPPVVSITGNTTYCAGQPISLTASPTSNVTYAWRGPGGYVSSTNPLVITNTTASQSGAYQVTVTDVNGCTAVATTNVVVYALPVATLAVNSTTMCYGQPISLTAGGGSSYAFSANVSGVSGNTASFTAALGTAQYSVTATSSQGCVSLPTTVTVTVKSCVNAMPDSGTAASGTGGVAVANVVANDLINTLPATLGVNGNATIAAIGTYPPGITLNTSTGSLSVTVGTPPGTYTITYQLCARLSPVTCATTTATVVVSPAPPVLTNDINTVNINGSVRGNVLTNDFDPQGLPLTASLTSPPASGTLTLNPTGSYTYTPPTGFTGLASFTYSACNSAGLCSPATATINVLANPTVGNNAPVAHNDATRTRLGQPVRINVLANDTDPDSATSLRGQLANPSLLTQPAQGSASVNPDGSVLYTPPAGFTGLVSFSYQVCDKASPALCASAQVTVLVLQPVLVGTPLAPVALDDALLTRQGVSATGDVSLNDSDANSPALSLSYAAGPASSGTVVLSPSGSYTYTPAPGFSGPASFTYAVCNSAGLCSRATVSILVQVTDKVALLARVYLQGALLGVYAPSVLMRDDLRAKGLLPPTSPYGSYGPLTSVGSLSASVTAVTGSDALVDWVYVELRSGTDNTVVVDSRSALLQRDGDVVDVDGVSAVRFDVALAGSYYVVVRHRNHLGVMSGLSIPLSVSGVVVDFRSVSTATFSYSASALNQSQALVDQGQAMWAGNAQRDNAATAPHEVIQFQGMNNDVNAIYQRVIGSSGNFFVTPYYKVKGYYDTDVDLNGETLFQGSGNDVEMIYQNVTKNHPGNSLGLPYFMIREQLP